MKEVLLKNKMNGDQFVCSDTKRFTIIDGVEYISVRRDTNPRTFLMRRDALERVRVNTNSKRSIEEK